MKYTTVGVGIAKSVFQLHWVDADTGRSSGGSLNARHFLSTSQTELLA